MCSSKRMSGLKRVFGFFVGVLVLASVANAAEPWIRFTDVPKYGIWTGGILYGEVGNVEPKNFKVAVYIFVEGWWTKPSFASPLTPIGADSKWNCYFHTGGYDQYATKIAAYLLPSGINPPQMSGKTVMPEIPKAVAFAQVERGPEARFLSFADRKWKVKKTDFPAGPGPNYFSDSEEDIWVDGDGLHLTVNKHGNRWYCSEVILQESHGYGTYAFQIHGRVDIIDPSMVAGIFTWDNDAPDQAYRELDIIEFSRWGVPEEPKNTQYVVHPWNKNEDRRHRFAIGLTDKEQDLTCYLIWRPGNAEFRTYRGEYVDAVPPENKLVHAWSYSGDIVPLPGKENIRFNFWLYEGKNPVYGKAGEFAVTGFSYSPDYSPRTIVQLKDQPDKITTNLPRYPILGYFKHADKVAVSVKSFAQGNLIGPTNIQYAEPNLSFGGFRYDVDLAVGVNVAELVVFSGKDELERHVKEIIYDPVFSTEGKKLLYSKGVAINLDDCYVLGLTPEFVALTNKGDYAVDLHGNVYSTSIHSLAKTLLNFTYREGGIYPVFSPDDVFCYSRKEKVRFSDGVLVSNQFPVYVDNRYANLLHGNRLADRNGNGTMWRIIDLNTDAIIGFASVSHYWPFVGGCSVSPSGVFGFIDSYGWACGILEVFRMDRSEKVFQSDSRLSDYMGQIVFSDDGQFAFIGSYGNSWYGEGGVYVYDLGNYKITDFYNQFGTSSVAVDSEGLVYASSRYVDHFGDGSVTQGSKDQRGIEVLKMNAQGELEFVRSFFLNNPHAYSTGRVFLIKTRIVK